MNEKSKKQRGLEGLRAEIDRIDGEIHALIRERAAIVSKVGAAKAGTDLPVLHPAREAAILRRLAAAHSGPFPLPSLLRIWREIIAASCAMQTELRFAVAGSLRDLEAQLSAHFGAMLDARVVEKPLDAVRRGRAEAAVLPPPEDGEGTPWWPELMTIRRKRQDIALMLQLPFLPGHGAASYVVGRCITGDSGADRTWLALDVSDVAEGEPLAELPLAELGLSAPRKLAEARGYWLVEANGYSAPDDLAGRIEKVAGRRAVWLGAFPEPMTPAS